MMPLEGDSEGRMSRLRLRGKSPRRIEPLAGDASTRRYFRAFFSDGSTAILSAYPRPGQNEEADFLSVQRYLQGLGLPVPQVYAHYSDEGLVILEDLGDDLLEAVVPVSDDAGLTALYQSAVNILLEMVQRTSNRNDESCPAFSLAFDMEKLMWEMDFFVTHFIRGFCGTDPSPGALAMLREFFSAICGLLAAEPRVFCHRDYHSRNLLLHHGRLVMIDFQDARMGPAQYDLASLLRDSYVTLPDELVDDLVEYYFHGTGTGPQVPSLDRLRYVFDIMSLQRNIKALGTFGYQSSVMGTDRYLSAIPRTGAYIARNIGKYSEFRNLRSAVEDYVVGPALAAG